MLTDSEKIDIVFKKLFGRAYGSGDKQYYEEYNKTALDIHANDIFSQEITIPPVISTDIIKKWYPEIEGGVGWITLVCDRNYNDNRVWAAINDWTDFWNSAIYPDSYLMRNFISPKYDVGYMVQVFDGSDIQISDLEYYFDYKSGILTFQNPRTETGFNKLDSIKIKVYQYLGTNLGQMILPPRKVDQFTLTIDSLSDIDLPLSCVPTSYEYLDVYRNGILLNNINNDDYIVNGFTLTIKGNTFMDEIITAKYQ